VGRPSSFHRIQDLASDQWGLVTRRQIEGTGIGETTLERLTRPKGGLERVARGVYQVAGAPTPDHRDLRAAWLQLASDVPAWKREPDQGVVSHRSAANLYGLGHLPADKHEFIVPRRRQTRRPDVRFHVRNIGDGEWVIHNGLPVTRPARIASDLLYDHEDPEAVAQIVADAIRGNLDYPGRFADSLAIYAPRFGLRRSDGIALLRWFLDLVAAPHSDQWLDEARLHQGRSLAGRLMTGVAT
jgi:hypothetical protein